MHDPPAVTLVRVATDRPPTTILDMVSELMRSLVVAGLVSGLQPITLMGLLVMRTGPRGSRNSFAFVAGAFSVETVLVVLAATVLADRVDSDSPTGRVFLGVRLALGVALVIVALRLRRPGPAEPPEVPASLRRLQGIGPAPAFVAGILLADYVGPVLASMSIASSSVAVGDRAAAILVYTIFATGIPLALLIVSIKRRSAAERIDGAMSWTMAHRRQIGSWLALVLGLLLVVDALTGFLVIGD